MNDASLHVLFIASPRWFYCMAYCSLGRWWNALQEICLVVWTSDLLTNSDGIVDPISWLSSRPTLASTEPATFFLGVLCKKNVHGSFPKYIFRTILQFNLGLMCYLSCCPSWFLSAVASMKGTIFCPQFWVCCFSVIEILFVLCVYACALYLWFFLFLSFFFVVVVVLLLLSVIVWVLLSYYSTKIATRNKSLVRPPSRENDGEEPFTKP